MRPPVPLLAALAALGTLSATRPARADDPDPWFGPDKALHFGVSAGLAGAGYGASSLLLDARVGRVLVGAGVSLTLGAGKELYDLTGHGDPSWKDLTWDVAGTALGVGLALLVDVLVTKDATDSRGEAHPRATGLTLRF